jgi:tripartite ATP-independent transporter DctP family solute receptor
MIRRRSMLTALAGATVAGSTLASPSRAQPAPTRLRVSTAAPPADFLAKALESMKAELDAAKVGLAVETYPAATLFKQGTEVPALQRGTLEMSTMTTFEVAQQMPEYGFFNRGYLFRDYAHLRHVFDGPIGQSYRKAVSDKMGIEILAVAYLGTRQVNLRKRRPAKTPADLSGVKMRMPGGPEWLLLGRALGVGAVPLGAPEVYLALKTGTIDGQENPLSIFNANKFYEVSEQVVLTSHLVQPVFINIATPVWNKLSPDQRTALETAAKNAGKLNDDSRLTDEKTITDGLVARGLTVDTPDIAAFRANADKVYGESDMAKAWNTDLMKQVLATA